ncbi:hypothetical protein ACFP1L_09800 [Lactiplantibacillus nangangensis]|uniref:Uncharacterized protein n=1 Tax=Lactiplantibacillus nangangensis TaxID=2559917 RepID=A0ABW1SLQ0_9LACO|nr:hypothetical protein [Lactiplantibacillus nangangensis]
MRLLKKIVLISSALLVGLISGWGQLVSQAAKAQVNNNVGYSVEA